MTLHEAEVLATRGGEALVDEDVSQESGVEVQNLLPLWKTMLLSFIALLQALFWLAVACYTIVATGNIWDGISCILIASTWLYAVCRPIAWPTVTPPYDLFVLYGIHLVMGILLLGGIIRANDVQGIPLPATAVIVAHIFNLIGAIILLGVTVSFPMGIQSSRIKKSEIVSHINLPVALRLPFFQGISLSPEDYTPLWKWITFSWIFPIIRKVCHSQNVVLTRKTNPIKGNIHHFKRIGCLELVANYAIQTYIHQII
jgi:hypothetical protein